MNYSFGVCILGMEGRKEVRRYKGEKKVERKKPR